MRTKLAGHVAQMLATKPRARWGGGGRGAPLDFAKWVSAAEAEPVNTGWPDFAVFGKDGDLKAFVEVKQDGDKLTTNQLAVLVALASFRPSFVWSPSEVVKINHDGTSEAANKADLIGLL